MSEPTLSLARIAALIAPFYPSPSSLLLEQLAQYLELLLKWNARTNLSAIREPEAIVRRHFGESLFVAGYLPAGTATLLDLGSGAGFPGVPVQLAHPSLAVTLAESQNKKSAFLREVVRSLGLPTAIHAGRAESLPAASFDVVALRAVDKPDEALALAGTLVRPGGTILLLGNAVGEQFYLLPGGQSSGLNVIARP